MPLYKYWGLTSPPTLVFFHVTNTVSEALPVVQEINEEAQELKEELGKPAQERFRRSFDRSKQPSPQNCGAEECIHAFEVLCSRL